MADEGVERVRRMLLERGTDQRAVDAAMRSGRVGLLVAERLVFPKQPRFTAPEVADAAAMPFAEVEQLWRALGFPAVRPDDPFFTEDDIEALAGVNRLLETGIVDPDTAVLFARVIGSSMARVAEAEVGIEAGGQAGQDGRLDFAESLLRSPDNVFDIVADLLVYVWRRHLQAAIRRAITVEPVDDAGNVVVRAVGFADLVGFTALSQQLSDEALGRLVSRFEETAHNAVTGGGGRVVKMIGDEVMFVVDDLAAAARIGLALAEVFADDEVLSDVRVGLAHGPVLGQEGDYFGPVVNLASRLVNIAYPGTVIVPNEVHEALAEDPQFAWKSLRTRHIKDIGAVPLWVLRRREDEDVKLPRKLRRPLRTLLSEAGFQGAERNR